MADERKVQLGVEVDASGARKGFDEVKQSARDMAQSVTQAGDQAGTGLDKVGDGAEVGAKKVDRATQSIITAIKRATTESQKAASEIEAGSAGSAEALEGLARRKAADASALQPWIAGLREARSELELLQAAQREASAVSLFEKQHQEAAKLVRDSEYVALWTSALNDKARAEAEVEAAALFDRQHQAAARLVQDSEYVRMWTDQLARKEAAERDAESNALFEKEHQAAKRLVQDAEYVAFWTREIEKKEAAERTAASQNAFVASLKQQSDAIGKTRADLLEMQAAQMGVTADAAPYIARLREAELNHRKVGLSANEMSFALRGVPAQFTDIVTSLQAGQNPIQVFLQQGGQLRDMFGGIGPAAKALGGYVVGLINPLTLAAAAAGVLAVAYHQGSKEADAYNKALVMTGNAAGTTADRLASMAERISDTVGTQGKAAEVLAQMAGSGRVAAGSLEEFSRVAVETEKALGIAAEKMVEDLAELGKSPVEASVKLNEKYRYLTASIYEQIKALEDQGKTEQAAALAQQAYSSAFDQRSREVVENLGLIERGWKSVIGAAMSGWDAILNIGRKDTGADRLSEVADEIAELQLKLERASGQNASLGTGLLSKMAVSGWKERLDLLRQEQAALQEVARMQERGAESAAANSRANEARIAWLKEGDKYLSKAAQMEREITKARNEGATAGATQAEIEARIGKIREKYADKSAFNKAKEEARKLNAALMEGFGLTGDFYAEWERLSKLFASGKFGKGAQAVDALAAAQARLLEKQPAIRAATQASEKADKESAKAATERAKALRDAITAEADRANAMKLGAEKMREELVTLGMTAQQLAVYRIGKLEAAAAAEELAASNLEEAASIAAATAGNEDAVEHYRALAQARREAAVALRDQANIAVDIVQKQAAVDAMNASVQSQVAMWQSIDQTAHDTFVSIFDSGKDVFERLRDTLKNTLYDLLYQMTVRKWLIDISAAVSGQGVAQQAFGSSGGGGGMGGIGNAYSAYNNASIGYQWASGSMSTANAFGTMYANATGTGLDGLLATNGAYGTAPAAGGFSMAGLGGAGAGAYLGYQLTGGNLGGAALGGVAGYGAASGIASGAGAYSGMAASLGAIPVWGWIAIAALAIYSATAKGGTPHLGAAVLTGEDDSQRLLRHEEQIGNEQVWGGFKGAEEALTEPLKSIGLGAAKTIEDTLANFGIDKQVSVFSAFGADDDDPSRGILRVFGEDGNVIAENTSDGNRHRGVKYDDDPQKGFEQFVDDGGRVIRDALVAADLPGWVDDILLSLGDAPGLALVNQTIAQINTIKKTAETLGPALGITAEGLAGIVENTGNLDTAISLLNTYAELSLTSAEKWSFAQRSLVDGFDDLGVAVPKSTDEFERLLRGIDQTSDAGQELYTGLLALAPAFYNVAGAVEEAFASISKSTADLVQKFQMDVMTDSERYAYFDSQIAILDAKIDAATDPTELAALIDERNQALLSAWNLLTDEQKAANLPAFTDIAMDGESSAQARLSVTPIDSPESEAKRSEKIAEEAQKTREAITTGIANGMERVAEMFTTSSGNLDAAAAKLRESASELRASVGGSFSSGGEVVYG